MSLLSLATISLLLAAPESDQPSLPTLLVAPLKGVGVDPLFVEILSEEMRTYAGRSEHFSLITPEEMAAIDKELARQLSGGCDETSCIAELGGALGAQVIVTGKLSFAGKRFTLNAKLIDIATVTARKVATRRAFHIEELQDQMAPLIAELLGDRPPKKKRIKKGLPPLSVAAELSLTAVGLLGTFSGVFLGPQNQIGRGTDFRLAIVADVAFVLGATALLWLRHENNRRKVPVLQILRE
jgi:TolB-like protein